jgi:thiamine-phosphate pyrophosphorylase
LMDAEKAIQQGYATLVSGQSKVEQE